jgi:hypothetical protein
MAKAAPAKATPSLSTLPTIITAFGRYAVDSEIFGSCALALFLI